MIVFQKEGEAYKTSRRVRDSSDTLALLLRKEAISDLKNFLRV